MFYFKIFLLFVIIFLWEANYVFSKSKKEDKTKREKILKEIKEEKTEYKMLSEEELLIKQKLKHNPQRKKNYFEISSGYTTLSSNLTNFNINTNMTGPVFSLTANNGLFNIPIKETYLLQEIQYKRAEIFFDLTLEDSFIGTGRGNYNNLNYAIILKHFFTHKIISPNIDFKIGFNFFNFDTSLNSLIAKSNFSQYEDIVPDTTYIAPITGIKLDFPIYYFNLFGEFNYHLFTHNITKPLYSYGQNADILGYFYKIGMKINLLKEFYIVGSFEQNRYNTNYNGNPLREGTIQVSSSDLYIKNKYTSYNLGLVYNF
jgi:hypothetical protein